MAIKTIEETNLELEKLVDLFRQLPDSNQQEQLPKPLIPIMNIGAKSIVNDINNILYSAIEERIIEVNAIKIKTELDINSKKSEEKMLLSAYIKKVLDVKELNPRTELLSAYSKKGLDVKEVNPKTELTFIKNLPYNTTPEGTSANTITFKLTDFNNPIIELDLGNGEQPRCLINLKPSEIKSLELIKADNSLLSPVLKKFLVSRDLCVNKSLSIFENYANFKGMTVQPVASANFPSKYNSCNNYSKNIKVKLGYLKRSNFAWNRYMKISGFIYTNLHEKDKLLELCNFPIPRSLRVDTSMQSDIMIASIATYKQYNEEHNPTIMKVYEGESIIERLKSAFK